MKKIIKTSWLTTATFLLASSTQVFGQQEAASSLSGLLDLVENDRVAESREYQERVQQFESNANQQQQFLETTEERILEQERLQTQLSDEFEANEIIIADKRDILRDRRGDLNELFGNLQGIAVRS